MAGAEGGGWEEGVKEEGWVVGGAGGDGTVEGGSGFGALGEPDGAGAAEEGLAAARADPPETLPGTQADEHCAAGTLRPVPPPPFPDLDSLLKMGPGAKKWRERIESRAAEAGLAVEDFPEHWTRARGGRDVVLTISVQRLGLVSITKKLRHFALTDNQMTEAERDNVEEKLLEAVWSKLHRALGAKRSLKRGRPAGEPSASASSSPSPAPRPLGVAGSDVSEAERVLQMASAMIASQRLAAAHSHAHD